MPRSARIKSCDSIYHIMCRSISDTQLYKDDRDKNKYLSLIKKYQIQFQFKVYAYCLMGNHVHLIIDSNGEDISKIMHGINQSYAQYFNKRYDRHGHLFQDRFKSKIVRNEKYLITLSIYIHNNPSDIKRYKHRIEEYRYSSMGVYIGARSDSFNIVDENFIFQLFSKFKDFARKKYKELVYKCENDFIQGDSEFKNEKSKYNSERVILARGCNPQSILSFLEAYLGEKRVNIFIKYNRNAAELRAIYVLLMRCFCGYSQSDICKELGNLTQCQISRLCSKAVNIVQKNSKYSSLICDFISACTA